ncbi:MAG: hypothetical protein GZ089_10485, partial [Aromatoleum sp.]|nr:hypothetical protein [Aromatoleum sp.]
MTARNAAPLKHSLRLSAVFVIVALFAGCQNPWIRVQNLGSSGADITITYYDDNGQPVTTDGQQLPSGQAANFAEGSNNNLPRGYRGSAVIESDQPALALRRVDMAGNTGDMLDGDILNALSGGGSLYLPLIMSHAGAYGTWSSRVSLQNVGDATACVTLTYISATTGTEVSSDPRPPSPRGSTEAGCPNGGHPLAPRATLYRDPDSFGVPAGFTGAIRIDTSANAQNISRTAQLISASVDNWNAPF